MASITLPMKPTSDIQLVHSLSAPGAKADPSGQNLISGCPRWVYHCLSNSFPPMALRNAVCANDSGSNPPASFTHWASDF